MSVPSSWHRAPESLRNSWSIFCSNEVALGGSGIASGRGLVTRKTQP